ncbi:MAG: phosphotransferase [Eubacteriales bacterium]|jgi:Ser/Thr protein kinase RdoA (MazF antagonist)|nr:phosphotransferase [Eubacteriales bacterium]
MVSDNLLSFAANNYGFDKGTLHFISESTNQIYSFQKSGKRYILRFSERPAEQTRQTKAEMDWLYYLANNNIGVSLPLPVENGELVISTEDNGKPYIISVFEALHGKFWNKNDPALWNEKIFFNWGKVMGDIHRLTKNYSPTNNNDVRSEFTGHNALFLDNMKNCSTVYKVAEDLINEIMSLPKDIDSYGLIHYDIHPWNFIIDGEKINVFDFDDSLYGWFALDIGIALYHGLWWGRKNDAGHDFTNVLIKCFLDGYLSVNLLSDYWISKIPLFMKYRQICKLSWFYNPDHEDDNQSERIRNIENGVLFTGCEIDTSLFTN